MREVRITLAPFFIAVACALFRNVSKDSLPALLFWAWVIAENDGIATLSKIPIRHTVATISMMETPFSEALMWASMFIDRSGDCGVPSG